jgi:E3 ubiquitin-protein ligase EDD1
MAGSLDNYSAWFCIFKINKSFLTNRNEVSGVTVKQVVVATTHCVLLMDNGRIYRIPYSVSSDNKEKSDDDGASTSSVLSGSRGGSPRSGEQELPGFSSFAQRFSNLVSRRGRLGGRRTGLERRSDRLGRILLARNAAMVPTSDIPEELIEEALSVLQGKSREVVIRELQRTNLDVNTAVNNLLSRDDDDDVTSEHDDINLFPSGDELLTLLGSGAIGEEEMEEILAMRGSRDEGYRRGESRTGAYYDTLVAQEIRSWVTLADRAAIGGSMSSGVGSSSSLQGTSRGKGSSQHTSKDGSSFVHFSSPSCWRDKDDAKHFSIIATTSSELLAVDDQGQLYGWPWSLAAPPILPHPRLVEFGLQGERIKYLSARVLRASAVTESGRIVTWVDSAVSKFARSLEHTATFFPELSGETVVYLDTCELFTSVFTDSGKVYWW